MRVEQTGRNVYRKKPDKVESHVLRIAERFMETDPEAILGTREEIIQEAIKRIRQDQVSSLRQVIITEMRKAVASEFGTLVDQRINDVVLAIYQGLYTVPVLKKHEFRIKIEADTFELVIPSETVPKMKPDDACDVFINGILQADFTPESTGQYTTLLRLPETDQLLVGDDIYIRFFILYEESN